MTLNKDKMNEPIFTKLLDRHCKRIYEGSILRTGMRRDYMGGWTVSKVVLGQNLEWLLADLKTGEKMQMQYDQELRELVENEDSSV
jgi:hypothetical protein